MEIKNTSAFIKPKKLDFRGSSWIGHVPFGSWLITELNPKVFVELGTHKGMSFLTFSQSILENNLQTKAYAVDTWSGDHQAGYYGDEIYIELKDYIDENYPEFTFLKKMTFDEAAESFENGSVDLLHIDGLHTYEAVKHDFEVWFPKLSDRGVVIFHDTFEKKKDFGVYKFWEEILKKYPGFEFKFWHGLGVLLVGENRNEYLLELCENNGENEKFKLFNSFFEKLANDLRIVAEREILEENLKQEVEYAKSLEKIIRGDERTLEELQSLRQRLESDVNSQSEEKNLIKKELKILTKKLKILTKKLNDLEIIKDDFKKINRENEELRNQLNRVYLSRSWKFSRGVRALENIIHGKGIRGNKERFKKNWYLKNNPDVFESGGDPYEHYMSHGKHEGRLGAPDTFLVRNYRRLRIVKTAYKTAKSKDIKFSYIIKKGFETYKYYGISGVKEKIVFSINPKITNNEDMYQKWVELYDELSIEDIFEMKESIENFQYKPLISVLMPVYNTDIHFLKQALDSVIEQTYDNWELCIADDNSPNEEVREILKEYENKDSRIKVIYRKENGHISLASNSALELVTGEFTALMDHDDLIPKHALYMVVWEINRKKGLVDLIYTDEDKIDGENIRYDPYFKMEWNETLINSQNFVAHLGIYRTSILKKIGGFRKGFEGSQDYDILLRFLREISSDRISHIPHVLYHWRIFKGNHTFSTDNHNISDDSAYKALKEHYEILKEDVRILPVDNFPGCWKIKRQQKTILPKVSLIIPTRDRVEILKNCVDGLQKNTDYDDFEVIIVDNDSKEKKTLEYFDKISADSRIKILKVEGEFNYSKLNNLAVKEAKGEYLVFMNNDLEIIKNDWLKEMIYTFSEENVGIVGAKLYYSNNTIQHAGCVTGVYGVAGHIHKHLPKNSPGYFGRLGLIHNVSAVTGACLAISKKIFEEVNGFDEEKLKVSYNDVDLCLKVRDKGYKIIFNPEVELYHLESISRGKDESKYKKELNRNERREMISRYGEKLKYDPYYSVNLSLENEDVTYSFSPRKTKPWRDYIEFVCPFHRGDVLIGIQVANYCVSIGKKVRFHVSEKLVDWVRDFSPNFEVLEIPIGIPQAHETMNYFEKAVNFVEKRKDFSGKIARSHPKMDFDFMGLNIVEHMLNELEISIDTKIEPLKPSVDDEVVRKAKEILEKFGDGKIVLLHPFGGWNLKSIPSKMIHKLIEICKKENVKLIQIGGKNDKKVEKLDGWILENYSLSQWRSIFEQSEALIGIDSWTSHLGAILGIKQITLYGSTRARDVNIKKFLTNQNEKNIILDTIVDCSPCHSLKCKYSHKSCIGYELNEQKIKGVIG